MRVPDDRSNSSASTRRDFLKSSGAAAGAALAGHVALAPRIFAAGSDTLKVGLVGCGGRGSGAATDALRADPQARLTAMGDVFADKLPFSLAQLKESEVGGQVDVAGDRQFLGFDAYR
ncbi:MAG: twin-arginine translocation signal domain-containing protein, partial [Planctomycetaceae bacterium]